jgi:UMF1 family MFS transporter
MSINRNKKAVFGWSMYDWANSVFALAITTAIFPTYYAQISRSSDVMIRMENNMSVVSFFGFEVPSTSLYSYAVSFAYFIIVLLSPVLGAIADYSSSKKKFMIAFCFIGSLSCSLMYFFDSKHYELGIILFILAAIGYAGGNIFNDAFLPEITEPENYAKVSAKGFMMGYIGSVIQLIICLVLIMKYKLFGFKDSISATKLSFVLVGLWWFLFAQVTFFSLKENKIENKNDNLIIKGFEELYKALIQLKSAENTKNFLIAFLFYNMGLQTVLLMASLFGTEEIGLKTPQLILTVLIIQIVAIFGSQFFAFCSTKFGCLNTILYSIIVWIIVCITAYFITKDYHFYILAIIVGFIMGGTQAISRATYSFYLPETKDNASFFSFYSIIDKISIILGLFIYGFVNQITQDMRTSILFLITFFFLGILLLLRMKKRIAYTK